MIDREAQDVNTRGKEDLEPLKGLNRQASDEDEHELDLSDFANNYTASLHRAMRESLPVENVGFTGLHESRYDKEVTDPMELLDLDEARAQRQSGIAQLGAGIAKGAVLAGTTFLDGTMGLVTGVVQGVANLADNDENTGFWSGVIDNPFSRCMQQIVKASEDAMPVYRAHEQQEKPWYDPANLFSTAFIGDDLIKQLGFSVGAFYGGSLWTSGLKIGAGLAKAAKAIKLVKNVSDAPAIITSGVGATLSALNEGRIEAINNSDDWYKFEKGKMDDDYTKQLDAIGQPYVKNEDGSIDLVGDISDEALDLRNIYQATNEDLDKKRIKMANKDLLYNMPILLASNLYEFGKLYARGFRTGRRVNNIMRRTKGEAIERGIRTGFKRMASEGAEEGLQQLASDVSGEYYDRGLYNFYLAQKDPEATEKTVNWLDTTAEAIARTAGDASTWEQVFAGGLTGGFGMPGIQSIKGPNGKFRSPIHLQEGFAGAIKDSIEEAQRENKLLDEMDKRKDDPKFKEYYQKLMGVVRHNKLQEDMESFLENDDKFGYENAAFGQLVSDVALFDNAGKLDDLYAMIDEAFDTSDENLEAIIQNTIRTVTDSQGKTKKVGPFISENGSAMNATEDGKKEMIESLTKAKDSMHKTIENYISIKNELDTQTGQRLDDEQLEELTWIKSQLGNWEDRNEDLGKHVQNSLDDILTDINEQYQLSKQMRDQYKPDSKEYKEYDTAANTFKDHLDKINRLKELKPSEFGMAMATPLGYVYATILANTEHKFDDLEKDELLRDVIDLKRINEARASFNVKLKEYLANPNKIKEDHKQGEENIANEEFVKRKNALKEKLSKAASTMAFKQELNEESNNAIREEVMNELDKEGNPVAHEYKAMSSYKQDLETRVDDLDIPDEVKGKVKEMIGLLYGNSHTLADMQNPESEYIKNPMYVEKEELSPEENEALFQAAQYNLLKIMGSAKQDNQDKEAFTQREEDTPPPDKSAPDKNNPKSKTVGTDNDSTVGTTGNKSEAVHIDKATGDKSDEDVKSANDELNKEADKELTEKETQEHRHYYRPAIPEFHIEGMRQGEFIPLNMVAEIQKLEDAYRTAHGKKLRPVDFHVLYNYLESAGAFRYVNEGNLKVGDELGFMIDPVLEEQMKSYSWYKGPTILLIDKKNNQIVGSLDESQYSVDRYEGLSSLEEKIRNEFANRSSSAKPFTTNYKYDGEMSAYNIQGKLDRIENGAAIYVDSNGQPSIILAATGNNTFIGIFREQGSNRWFIKMENSTKDKNFGSMISSVMAQLPIGAEIYERTSISLDGLRVFAQQLNHGFTIGNDTYETSLNGADLANTFNMSQSDREDMSSVLAEGRDINEIRQILKPYLEKFGVKNIEKVVFFGKNTNGDDVVRLKLPTLVKQRTESPASKTGKFIATPTTRVSRVFSGRLITQQESRNVKDIPDVPSSPIFGIVRHGVIDTNGAVANSDIKYPSNMSNKEGMLYMLLPNAEGKYTPAAMRTRKLSKSDFNPGDSAVQDTDLYKRLYNVIKGLANSFNEDELTKAVSSLGKVIYSGDLHIDIFKSDKGNGIRITKVKRDADGNEIYSVVEGKKVRDEQVYVIFNENKDNTPVELNEVIAKIFDALIDCNLPIQVDVGSINKGSYNKNLIESGVFISNLKRAKVGAGWFILDYFDESGNIKSADEFFAEKQDTTGMQSVTVGNMKYKVDLKSSKVYDSHGKEILRDKQLILDMAYADNLYGTKRNAVNMIDNCIVLSNGAVLDRTKGKYLTGEEARKVKDKLNGIKSKEETVTSTLNRIFANQRRVDRTLTDNESYYILEDDGQYHKYTRVHGVLGDNWIGPKSDSTEALQMGTLVDSIIRDFFKGKQLVRPENVSEKAFDSLIKTLENIKETAEKNGERLITDNIVVFHKYSNGTRIAGELDILSVDNQGNFKIYDIKTGKYSFYGENSYFEKTSDKQRMTTKEYYTMQLSAYKNLFETQYGIPVKSLALMPFVLSYKDGVLEEIQKEKGIPITYNPAVQVPLERKVQPMQKQAPELPIFNVELEKKAQSGKSVDLELPSMQGFYDSEGKLYSGTLTSIGSVQGIPIHMMKFPVVTKGFGTVERQAMMRGKPAFEVYAVFPNGYIYKIIKLTSSSDKELAELVFKALEKNPAKVKELTDKKTVVTDNYNKPDSGASSGAAETVSAEQAIRAKDDDYEEDFDIGNLRKVDEERPIWNKEKELEWLNRVLPQLSKENRPLVVKGLIHVGKQGGTAWGMLSKGMMILSDIAAEGTAYHEAFHAVFHLLLDNDERLALLDEARKMYGEKSDLELEEDMAEGFREYVQTQEETGLLKKIRNFFRELWIKITNWKRIRPHLLAYYQMINEGKYAGKELSDSLISRSRTEQYTEEMQRRYLKSATDNIGTFSKTDNDIRYRRTDNMIQANSTFESLDNELKESLLKEGWTQEMFDSVSEKEREHAVKCSA